MINILIRYLGIKTKLLEPIKTAIDEVTPPGGGVLDLFAGSNSVGQYLMKDYTVYSNDYQAYSYIAARALIEHHAPEIIRRLHSEIVFGEFYRQNLTALEQIFEQPLHTEAVLLDTVGECYYGEVFDQFADFYNTSPYYGSTEGKHTAYRSCLHYYTEEAISVYKANPTTFPYLLFTTYYANPYFSLRQCVEIDSIRYSLDQLLAAGSISQEEHTIYLSFLIYSLNLIVTSVGDHFAQPQKIKDVSADFSSKRDSINLRERKKIIGKKRTSVTGLYREKLEDYKANYRCGQPGNMAFHMDFKMLLQSPELERLAIHTVYIDPPYTNAHYSRFYHIPETLVLYDYPDIEFFGRYRTDRYQSGFCIKSQAKEEFRLMLHLLREHRYNAVISYSDTAQCMLSIDDISELCEEYYGAHVLFQNVAHMYRNFGQKPNKVLAKEYIITCYI